MLFIKAKFPTNKLIVKPIPVRIDTAYKEPQDDLLGLSANFNLTDINEKTNTPICFPKNNPKTIPKGTGFNKLPNDKPSKATPALANANIGIIPKAT